MKKFFVATMLCCFSAWAENGMDMLAQGWPSSYQSVLKDLKPNRSYLLLHVELAKAYVDLRSAEHLRRSLLATPPWNLKDDEMGHVAFGWKCSNSKSVWKFGFTSQSGDYAHQTVDMITHGWGLAALSSEFTDGILLTPEQNEKTHIAKPLHGRELKMIYFLQEVPDSDCENVIRFLTAYAQPTTERPFPASGSYGLTLSPGKLEGGACNSLAITALDIGNFFGDIAGEKMYRSLGLPTSKIGRPMELNAQYAIPFVNPESPIGYEVNFKQLLNEDWIYSGKGPVVHMADSELLLLFLRSAYEESLISSGASTWKKFRAIYPLRRWMMSRTSDSSISESNGVSSQEIDENFDRQAAEIYQEGKSWYRKQNSQGLRLQRRPWGTQIGFTLLRP